MIAAGSAAVLVFALDLWAVVGDWPPLRELDEAAATAAQRAGTAWAWWVPTWTMVSVVLGPWVFRAVAVVAVVVVLAQRSARRARSLERREAVIALAITILVGGFVPVAVKALVGRARPPEALVTAAQSSFPSAHAFGVVVAFGAAMAFVRMRSRGVNAQLWVVGSALVVLVCAARALLAVHYVSDVVAGAALGVAWLALAFTVLTIGRSDPAAAVSASGAAPAR